VTPKTKTRGSDWLKALGQQKLEVRSARDALQVKGWLDTGNYALNWAVSGRLTRGYPLGHTVEIFGDPSTGKSYLLARALAMVQAAGGYALLDDVEGGYNLEHVARLGVDVDQLAHRRSRTVAEHLRTALAFIKAYRAMGNGHPAILACDSLAQLTTDHELKELDKRDMTKAAELKKFFRVVGGDLLDLPVVHLSANHTIAAIGSMFQTRTTPGGGGPKFMASVRIDLRATSKIRAGDEVIGTICRAVVDKNRVAPPWKEARLAIPFDQPVSPASGLVPLLVSLGVLEEQGQFLRYQKTKIGRAFRSKDKFLDQDAVGTELLAKYPDILAETDAALEAGKLRPTTREEEPAAAEDGEAPAANE
jgi:recombination protein RecA